MTLISSGDPQPRLLSVSVHREPQCTIVAAFSHPVKVLIQVDFRPQVHSSRWDLALAFFAKSPNMLPSFPQWGIPLMDSGFHPLSGTWK